VWWFAYDGVGVHAVSRAPLNMVLDDMKSIAVAFAIGALTLAGLLPHRSFAEDVFLFILGCGVLFASSWLAMRYLIRKDH